MTKFNAKVPRGPAANLMRCLMEALDLFLKSYWWVFFAMFLACALLDMHVRQWKYFRIFAFLTFWIALIGICRSGSSMTEGFVFREILAPICAVLSWVIMALLAIVILGMILERVLLRPERRHFT